MWMWLKVRRSLFKMVRKRKSAMKSNKKNEVAKPLVEEDQPGIDEKKDCELSERSQFSVAEKTKGSRKPYKAKKASAVDAFDVAEASSQVLPIGDSNAGQGKLKPLYPPSGRSVMVVESLIKAKVIQNCLGDMYEAFPRYGHVRDLAGRSRSVRPDDDFSMVWEVPATASTHLKSIKVALSGLLSSCMKALNYQTKIQQD